MAAKSKKGKTKKAATPKDTTPKLGTRRVTINENSYDDPVYLVPCYSDEQAIQMAVQKFKADHSSLKVERIDLEQESDTIILNPPTNPIL